MKWSLNSIVLYNLLKINQCCTALQSQLLLFCAVFLCSCVAHWFFLFQSIFRAPERSCSRRHVMRTPGDPGRGGGFGGDSSAGCFWRMGCRSWGQPCVLSPACRPQRPGGHRQSPHPSKGYGPCSVLEFESQGVRWWCLLLTWSRNRLHLFWLLSVGERKWKWETVCWLLVLNLNCWGCQAELFGGWQNKCQSPLPP